jgi:hypothetical protein
MYDHGALFRLFGGMLADFNQGLNDPVETIHLIVPYNQAVWFFPIGEHINNRQAFFPCAGIIQLHCHGIKLEQCIFLCKAPGLKNEINILTIYFLSGIVAIYTQILRANRQLQAKPGMAYRLKR